MPAPLKPRPLAPEILADFADGVLELRGAEVWRVKRHYKGGGIHRIRPTRRIDKPTKLGANRIVIRRGAKTFHAMMPAVFAAFNISP